MFALWIWKFDAVRLLNDPNITVPTLDINHVQAAELDLRRSYLHKNSRITITIITNKHVMKNCVPRQHSVLSRCPSMVIFTHCIDHSSLIIKFETTIYNQKTWIWKTCKFHYTHPTSPLFIIWTLFLSSIQPKDK